MPTDKAPLSPTCPLLVDCLRQHGSVPGAPWIPHYPATERLTPHTERDLEEPMSCSVSVLTGVGLCSARLIVKY